MSDFILPGDLSGRAQQVAQDIADAWSMLTKLCVVKQYPLDIAEAKVYYHVNTMGQLTEIEAIRKVYYEIAKG